MYVYVYVCISICMYMYMYVYVYASFINNVWKNTRNVSKAQMLRHNTTVKNIKGHIPGARRVKNLFKKMNKITLV